MVWRGLDWFCIKVTEAADLILGWSWIQSTHVADDIEDFKNAPTSIKRRQVIASTSRRWNGMAWSSAMAFLSLKWFGSVLDWARPKATFLAVISSSLLLMSWILTTTIVDDIKGVKHTQTFIQRERVNITRHSALLFRIHAQRQVIVEDDKLKGLKAKDPAGIREAPDEAVPPGDIDALVQFGGLGKPPQIKVDGQGQPGFGLVPPEPLPDLPRQLVIRNGPFFFLDVKETCGPLRRIIN